MGEPKLTRRTLLSIIAGIFYPLGLAAPLVVKAKIALKRIVVRGLAWDEEIQKEDDSWSRRWLLATERLNEIALPRCLFPSEHTVRRTELHTFSDASKEAFATVIFIRNVHEDGTVVTRFVMAKTKVAPSKTISVAKLEQQAALLGARVANSVQEALTRLVHRRYFWTDSSSVRNWIRSTAAYYKPFVNHRIGKIQTLTEP